MLIAVPDNVPLFLDLSQDRSKRPALTSCLFRLTPHPKSLGVYSITTSGRRYPTLAGTLGADVAEMHGVVAAGKGTDVDVTHCPGLRGKFLMVVRVLMVGLYLWMSVLMSALMSERWCVVSMMLL